MTHDLTKTAINEGQFSVEISGQISMAMNRQASPTGNLLTLDAFCIARVRLL